MSGHWPRLGYALLVRGMSSLSLALQAYSEFLSNFFDRNRLRRDFLHNGLRFDGCCMGHIVAEHFAKRRNIIGENLCILRTARNGNIGHAAVEQVFRAQFRVYMRFAPVASAYNAICSPAMQYPTKQNKSSQGHTAREWRRQATHCFHQRIDL